MTTLLAAARSRLAAATEHTGAFSAFLAGLTVSKLGDALYAFALPWIAYELTGSAVVMGTLYATEIIPILLFGAFTGVYVDRWDRRRLMLTSDLMRAALVALIPLAQLAGVLAVWHLYVVAFGLSLISMMFDVATTAVIPEMARAGLDKANAAHQTAMQVAAMTGPALAGLVIAAVGGFQALWIDSLSFAGTFLVLLAMPPFQQQGWTGAAQSVTAGIAQGFRWLMGSPVIRVLSLQAMIGNFGYGMVNAVLMFYLRSTLGLSAQLAGLDYALPGVGGVLGSIAIVPLVRRFRRGTLYPIILAFGAAGLLLMATVRTWWMPGVGFGMVAACNVAWVVLSTSVRQELIPRELMGRVLSFTRILSTAAMPVGATVAGLMTHSLDPALIFLVAAGCKAVEVTIARRSAMRRL